MSPYRDTLGALCLRREALLRELAALDQAIRQRAVLVIPCFTGLSRWQERKVRKAWETIRKHGHWDDSRCAMYHWEPCERPKQPCGVTACAASSSTPIASMLGAVALATPPPPQAPVLPSVAPERRTASVSVIEHGDVGSFPQPPPARILK